MWVVGNHRNGGAAPFQGITSPALMDTGPPWAPGPFFFLFVSPKVLRVDRGRKRQESLVHFPPPPRPVSMVITGDTREGSCLGMWHCDSHPRHSGSSCPRPAAPGQGQEPSWVSVVTAPVTLVGEELSEGPWGCQERQENERVTGVHPLGLQLLNFPGKSASS